MSLRFDCIRGLTLTDDGEELTEAMREAIHSDGFFCDDEVEEREDGSVWVRVDFFNWIGEFLSTWFGLGKEDDK